LLLFYSMKNVKESKYRFIKILRGLFLYVSRETYKNKLSGYTKPLDKITIIAIKCHIDCQHS